MIGGRRIGRRGQYPVCGMHRVSDEDRAFAEAFRAGRVPAADFGHREHVRMAYICLAGADPEAGFRRMRTELQQFLDHHDVSPGKYHETLTRGWMLAVGLCMEETPDTDSSAAFLARNARLLDPELLLRHYSKERLFSDAARSTFLQPDRAPFAPEQGNRDGAS